MEIIEQAYHSLFVVILLLLAFLIICCVLRSALGPRTADRIIAINMTGTMIIMIIAVLSVMLNQNYLVDICLIYAMISFLGVVVLCKIYTGVYLQKKNRKATLEAIAENIHDQQADTVKHLSEMPSPEPERRTPNPELEKKTSDFEPERKIPNSEPDKRMSNPESDKGEHEREEEMNGKKEGHK